MFLFLVGIRQTFLSSKQQSFCGRTKPVLAGTPVKKWRILLEQIFTAHVPLRNTV